MAELRTQHLSEKALSARRYNDLEMKHIEEKTLTARLQEEDMEGLRLVLNEENKKHAEWKAKLCEAHFDKLVSEYCTPCYCTCLTKKSGE